MIRIERAPAYATIQDSGRRGYLASGVPRAGAMDLPALYTLNAMLGNESSCAAVEWALTGGSVSFHSGVTFAIGGGGVDATLDGLIVEPWHTHHAAPGNTLTLGAPASGRFVYVAFAGGIAAPVIMRSRSTYLPGAFGGLAGRRLKAGDNLEIVVPPRRKRHQVSDRLPAHLRPPFEGGAIRFIPRGEPGLAASWRLSGTSDRMGYRLESGEPCEGASVTSEPVCPGVIQLPTDGMPIVLMADAPTIGGYRIAGGVITADLGVLAQRMPGDAIVLEPTSVRHAQQELARLEARIADVREWALS